MSVDKSQWPQWLKDADTKDARVEIVGGRVIWHGGVWRGGYWHDGDWRGGDWHGGVWRGGDWHGGVWRGGVWHGGVWRGGVWHDKTIDRIPYMASLSGVHLNADGKYVGYRSTNLDCTGRYTECFKQVEGEYYENKIPTSGGTCQPGIHVASMATALTYFGVQPSQLWRVTFEPKDLLDADGQKCRIRGGFFEKIDWPFYMPEA